jgi:hypothetical protein
MTTKNKQVNDTPITILAFQSIWKPKWQLPVLTFATIETTPQRNAVQSTLGQWVVRRLTGQRRQNIIFRDHLRTSEKDWATIAAI